MEGIQQHHVAGNARHALNRHRSRLYKAATPSLRASDREARGMSLAGRILAVSNRSLTN
jgi:hypothetical protein